MAGDNVVLFIFILIGWAVIIWLSALKKKLPVYDNVFLFFTASIFTTSVYTAIGLNFALLLPSKQAELYIASLVTRIVIVPLMLLVFINLFMNAEHAFKRWGSALLTLLVLNAVSILSEQTKVFTFQKFWNHFCSFIMLAVFMLVVWVLRKWFAGQGRNEAAAE